MTSGGSTGRPKVIVDAMPARWNPKNGFLGQALGDVILNPGPLYHNAPFHCIHMGLFVGATIVEMGRFDALRALELIEAHEVNWVTLVPTMMHRVWRLGPDVLSRFSLPSLRMMLHMAAPCPAWLKEAWIGWLGGERVWEYYGTTEGTGSTMISGADWLAHHGSVGRVRDGYELKILDEAGQASARSARSARSSSVPRAVRDRPITIWAARLGASATGSRRATWGAWTRTAISTCPTVATT